jgi:hypothetical protein
VPPVTCELLFPLSTSNLPNKSSNICTWIYNCIYCSYICHMSVLWWSTGWSEIHSRSVYTFYRWSYWPSVILIRYAFGGSKIECNMKSRQHEVDGSLSGPNTFLFSHRWVVAIGCLASNWLGDIFRWLIIQLFRCPGSKNLCTTFGENMLTYSEKGSRLETNWLLLLGFYSCSLMALIKRFHLVSN